MSRPTLKARVLTYLQERAGLTVSMHDVAKDLGITTQAVSGAVSALRTNPNLPGTINNVANGIYRFVPGVPLAEQAQAQAKTTGRCFEQIGAARDGRLVLQDEDGNLYTATAL